MLDWISLIIAALGGGGVAAIGTWIISWKKTKPEIAAMYEAMATKQAGQIDDLRTRLNKQDRKISKQGGLISNLRKCLREWEEGIRMLVEQITSNDMTPVWTPKALDEEIITETEEDLK